MKCTRTNLTVWILAFLLAGCDTSKDGMTHDNVASLLSDDNPKACVADEVIQTALATTNNEYPTFLENGGSPVTIDTVSATHINKDIHEITCSALMKYNVGEDGLRLQIPIEYKVRPALDQEASFVVAVANARAIRSGISLHMASSESKARVMPAVEAEGDQGIVNQQRTSIAPTNFSSAEQKLIDEADEAWANFRENPSEGDRRHNAALDKLFKLGVCWGRNDEPQAAYSFHRCSSDSIQMQASEAGPSRPLAMASFDCRKAATKVEKIICSDSEIAALDRQLHDAYVESRQDAVKRRDALLGQRAFITRRNQCEDRWCLVNEYKDWTQRLTAPQTSKTSINNWLVLNDQCRGSSGDNPATTIACDKRDVLTHQLESAGWCLRSPGESWHRC